MTTESSIRGQGGQTLPIVAVFMVCIVALAGLTIDVSNLLHVRAQMQSAADASATAGADTLLSGLHPSITDATDTAVQYGMAANGRNQVRGVVRTSVVQNVQVGCDDTYGACSYPDEPNTVDVKDSADVPLFFLGIFGIDTARVSVESEACAPCNPTGHDIVLVLDHTGSMLGQGKGTNGKDKLQNLQTGVLQGLLPSLNPTLDRVSLVVFPPVTDSNGICNEEDDWTSPDTYRDPTHRYLITPLSSGFLSPSGTVLSSSPLVQDVNCLVPEGRTDYADPLAVARQELDSDGRPGVLKDIVLISDGAADWIDDPTCQIHPLPGPVWDCNYPCQVGIQAAAQAKSDGITVFSIAYGDFGTDIDCDLVDGYDYPWGPHPAQMTGYDAMAQIATPGDYLPDPDPAQISGILHTVAGSLGGQTGSRLVK